MGSVFNFSATIKKINSSSIVEADNGKYILYDKSLIDRLYNDYHQFCKNWKSDSGLCTKYYPEINRTMTGEFFAFSLYGAHIDFILPYGFVYNAYVSNIFPSDIYRIKRNLFTGNLKVIKVKKTNALF